MYQGWFIEYDNGFTETIIVEEGYVVDSKVRKSLFKTIDDLMTYGCVVSAIKVFTFYDI